MCACLHIFIHLRVTIVCIVIAKLNFIEWLHVQVLEVAVVGVADEILGEKVTLRPAT